MVSLSHFPLIKCQDQSSEDQNDGSLLSASVRKEACPAEVSSTGAQASPFHLNAMAFPVHALKTRAKDKQIKLFGGAEKKCSVIR